MKYILVLLLLVSFSSVAKECKDCITIIVVQPKQVQIKEPMRCYSCEKAKSEEKRNYKYKLPTYP